MPFITKSTPMDIVALITLVLLLFYLLYVFFVVDKTIVLTFNPIT
jgi:hypothetical protein